MIPNLRTVSDGIYRGGQPDVEGFQYLKELGITQIVKLNTDKEGSDDRALELGIEVFKCPITVEDQLFWPDEVVVRDAVAFIKPNTFIHCGSDARTQSKLDQKYNIQGGQDRTGLVCAIYRLTQGWTKDAAEKEMLALGFHVLLLGLWEFWLNFEL